LPGRGSSRLHRFTDAETDEEPASPYHGASRPHWRPHEPSRRPVAPAGAAEPAAAPGTGKWWSETRLTRALGAVDHRRHAHRARAVVASERQQRRQLGEPRLLALPRTGEARPRRPDQLRELERQDHR